MIRGTSMRLDGHEFSVLVNDRDEVIAAHFATVDGLMNTYQIPVTKVPRIDSVHDALTAWMDGQCDALTEVAVRDEATPVIADIRSAMRTVKSGSVISYGKLAQIAGYPRYARTAGRACSTNRCAMFIPCHRIVRAGCEREPVIPGAYSGPPGIKGWLLRREGVITGTE